MTEECPALTNFVCFVPPTFSQPSASRRRTTLAVFVSYGTTTPDAHPYAHEHAAGQEFVRKIISTQCRLGADLPPAPITPRLPPGRGRRELVGYRIIAMRAAGAAAPDAGGAHPAARPETVPQDG